MLFYPVLPVFAMALHIFQNVTHNTCVFHAEFLCEKLKFDNVFPKTYILVAFARTTVLILGLFVLIWMHFYAESK